MEDGSLNVKSEESKSELQHIKNHVDNAVVSLVSEVRDVMELVENMNRRLSFVEAQCKANKKWCKEFQHKLDMED